MKKTLTSILTIALALIIAFTCVACNDSDYDELVTKYNELNQQFTDQKTSDEAAINQLISEKETLKNEVAALKNEIDAAKPNPNDYSAEAYEMIKTIDALMPDRDCYFGENFAFAQYWIEKMLVKAGYTTADMVEDGETPDITYQDVSLKDKYVSVDTDVDAIDALKSFSCDKSVKYKKSGWQYQQDDEGTFVKLTDCVSQNVIVTKKGQVDDQIIIGMHYDGDGTGDNGSGVALGLITAMKFATKDNYYTLKFVFFTGEEYGMYGSSAYAQSMSDDEIAKTLYLINMDSLVCGDYCYLYGGVQDNATKTVSQTEAYDNAMATATELGLTFKSNPWTWDNLAPENYSGEYPDYASPSTGDWSDHAPFVDIGVPYLYFEATNWEIPDYTGYGETTLIGMLMNTENDYLDYIEAFFPGRIQHHLSNFSILLTELLMQTSYQK